MSKYMSKYLKIFILQVDIFLVAEWVVNNKGSQQKWSQILA